jgi:hypothetical protein
MDTLVSLSFNCTKETQRAATTAMSAPGSAPFTSPAAPGRRTASTPTATPRPGDAVPQPRADVPQPAATPWEVFVTARSSLSEAIRAPDARQLGINVSPPSSLINLQTPGTPSSIGSDSEFLAIGALGGFSTASSFASSVPSTPARAGRHQDTTREYDGGMSRHPGAATNDAVIAGRSDASDTSSVLTDESSLFADFLNGIDDTDDSWLDAYYDGERRRLADGTLRIPDESLADLQRTAQTIDSLDQLSSSTLQQVKGKPAAVAATDMTDARVAIALSLKQDKGIQKLIESKSISLDDILDDDGQPDLQKLNRLRDTIRDETSRASESYVKAATLNRSAPQPIVGYNPTVPGYRRVDGTNFTVWQPARYADSVPS